MKYQITNKIIIFTLFMSITSIVNAGTAKCTINIWDLIKDNKYTMNVKFEYGTGDAPSLKKFDTPGNDYECKLVFHKIGYGTMISCAYKKDGGHTFFMSDRTLQKNEDDTANNLTFRHKSSHVQIKSSCR
jgi:hypothetical protein